MEWTVETTPDDAAGGIADVAADLATEAGGTERSITTGRRAGLTVAEEAISVARGNGMNSQQKQEIRSPALFCQIPSQNLQPAKSIGPRKKRLYSETTAQSMNIVIGTAVGIGGTLLSDEILTRNLPIDGGILRILFAPIHPCVGGLYALAATGSAPVLSTAILTAGVLILWDLDNGPHYYYSADRNVPPLRPLKNAARQLVAYLISNLRFSTKEPADEKKSDAVTKKTILPASKVSPDNMGFLASLAIGPIKAAQLDEAEDADDESEYVFC